MTKDTHVTEDEPTRAIIDTQEFSHDDPKFYDAAEALADPESFKLSKPPEDRAPGGTNGLPAGAGPAQKVGKTNPSTHEPYFDVGVLPPDVRKLVMDRTADIRTHLEKMHAHYIKIGQLLIEVKTHIPHGGWIAYLKVSFEPEWGLTFRTAENWMTAAEAFAEHNPYGEALPITALVELAKADDGIRNDVLDRVRDGERVTVKDIKELKKEAKQKATPAALAGFASDEKGDGATGSITTKPAGDGLHRELEQAVCRRAAEAVEEIMRGYGAFHQVAHAKLAEAAEKEAKGHANPLAKKTAAELGSEAASLREHLRTYADVNDGSGEGVWKDIERALYTLEGFRHATQSTGAPDIKKIAEAVRQLPEPAKSWMPEGASS